MTEQELVCPIMSRPIPIPKDNWNGVYDFGMVVCQKAKCTAWGYNVENRYCNEETEDCKKYEESGWNEVVCIGCEHAENIIGFCKLIERVEK